MERFSKLYNEVNEFCKICYAFKANLDKNKLSSLNLPEEKYDYLIECGGKLIGSGGSRHTFAISSKRAIKINKWPNSETNQNSFEYETLIEYNSNLLPKAYEHASDFSWIEVELCRPLKSKSEFLQLTGIKYNDFQDIIFDQYDKKIYLEDVENKFIQELNDLYLDSNIDLIEIAKLQNLGINSSGKIVILDVGMIYQTN